MENESDNLKPSVQDTSVQLEPTTEVAALPNKSETNGSLVQRFFKYWWLVAGLVGIALVVLLAFGVSDNREPHTAIKQFTNVYSFVPEKISRSALIPISLPEGVNKEAAQAGISFSPVVAGAWAEEDESGLVVFAPEQPLTVADVSTTFNRDRVLIANVLGLWHSSSNE